MSSGLPANERLYEEIAKDYVKDFNVLAAGEPCASFNLIRLSNLYAVASICYYGWDFSPLPDDRFDDLCRFLYDFYEQAIEAGVWGGTLERDMLQAGSGYHWSTFRTPLHNIAYFVRIIMQKEYSVKKHQETWRGA